MPEIPVQGEFTGTLYFADGSEPLPSVTFKTEPSTGMWLDGLDLAWSVLGVRKLNLSTLTLSVPDGSGGQPGLSFLSDTGTGIGLYPPNGVVVNTNTTDRWIFDDQGNILAAVGANQIQAADLGSLTPGFTFVDAPTTGLFMAGVSPSPDILGITVFGSHVWDFAETYMAPAADGNYSIGVSMLNRVQTIYLGTSVEVEDGGDRVIALVALPDAIRVARDTIQTWSANPTDWSDTPDTGIARNAAGVLEINTATAGVLGTLRLAGQSFGTNPATAGEIRLPSAGTIQFRNTINTANILALSKNVTGQIVISDTVAGITLEPPNAGLRINNQASGAGASAGTLLNAPSAGNPSFWLPISIAGAVRYIPCWT